MSTQAQTKAVSDAPPQMQMLEIMSGYWRSQSLYVAARLGLADLLKDGPQTSEELAARTGAHAPTLYRLLRALASIGVFAEEGNGRFGLTELAATLQSGPGSIRAMVLHLGERPSWDAWGDLLRSVQTGETAFARVHGMEVFPFYAEHPESQEPFNQAMTEAYDFSQFCKVVDVGGGHGGLMTAILKKSDAVKGAVFDMPAVVEGARPRIEAEGFDGRCEIVAGNFFDSVPEGGDAYTLKMIVHDWDEERALAILRNIHRAMKADGKLLVIETVIPEGNEPAFSKLGDLHMLIMTGGRERTAAEYAKLFDEAGFKLTSVIPTQSIISIVEAVKKA
jgi:O-methyltransferase domain/Dimerisation domain